MAHAEISYMTVENTLDFSKIGNISPHNKYLYYNSKIVYLITEKWCLLQTIDWLSNDYS